MHPSNTLERDSRWVLIRTSEDEDVIRIYTEGASDEETDMLITVGEQLLKSNHSLYN